MVVTEERRGLITGQNLSADYENDSTDPNMYGRLVIVLAAGLFVAVLLSSAGELLSPTERLNGGEGLATEAVSLEELGPCDIKFQSHNDKSAALHGIYVRGGVLNGHTYYEHTLKNLFLYFAHVTEQWNVGATLGSKDYVYAIGGSQDANYPDQITGPWHIYCGSGPKNCGNRSSKLYLPGFRVDGQIYVTCADDSEVTTLHQIPPLSSKKKSSAFSKKHTGDDIMADNELFYERKIIERDLMLNLLGNDTEIPQVFNYFDPYYTCPYGDQIAGSRPGDGGKWVCGLRYIEAPCVVYSFGSQSNSVFEDEIRKVTPCEIHVFDPTSKPLPGYAVDSWTGKYTYHKLGLLGAANTTFTQKQRKSGKKNVHQASDLYDIMNRFGHDHIDIFKVDIEKSEYAVFDELQENGFPKIGQIQVELHLKGATSPLNTLKLFMELVERAGFRLFHMDANFFCRFCMEYSFIHKDWTPEVYGGEKSHFSRD